MKTTLEVNGDVLVKMLSDDNDEMGWLSISRAHHLSSGGRADRPLQKFQKVQWRKAKQKQHIGERKALFAKQKKQWRKVKQKMHSGERANR